MTPQPNNGGPAFNDEPEIPGIDFRCMTLRDYFAAKAMQAIITKGVSDCEDLAIIIATESYSMADAMLSARQK